MKRDFWETKWQRLFCKHENFCSIRYAYSFFNGQYLTKLEPTSCHQSQSKWKIAILESEQKTCWVYTHFSWHESLVPIHRQLLHIWCRCWTNYIQLRVGKILFPTQNIFILSSDFVEFSQLLRLALNWYKLQNFNFWMIRLIKIPILPNYTPISIQKRQSISIFFIN